MQQSREQSVPRSVRITPDRRKHRRVSLVLLGRFMRQNKLEYPCKLIDISVGGAAFLSPIEVELGERVVIYLDELGGLEGHVVRHFPGGFALELIATQRKREKLAAQITWLINKHELQATDLRKHERIVPRNQEA
ncbi:MAG: PilZ domain-containing protein, partial [Hyphomicrobiaceae bacterium]